MSQTVDFVFDFGSPNAYLSHQVIPSIEERTGARFNYIPCLLGGIFKLTNNKPPMIAFGPVKGKMEYEWLESQRFMKKHGIENFKMNPHFPVNTLMLVRGAIVAEMDGRLAEYVNAGCAALWEQELKMDDPEVFVEYMEKAGFGGAELLERTKEDAVKEKLMANTNMAVERGAFGIPTFYVGDEMFFGKDRLQQVEEEILKQS